MAWPDVLRRGAVFSRFSHHHVAVFLLTFFSYSLLHASRKTFSNVKVSISKQWTPSAFNTSAALPVEVWDSNRLFPSAEEATLFLGTLDTIFLFSYAVGLFISGIVGDRLNLRWVLSFGMCSSALVVFVFGTVTEWLRFYNRWLYCGLWIVNGLLQSTGWPCVVAVMGNWFGKAGRGVVFGLWSACASVGNILGACLASSVLQYGYEYAFLVTASVQFAGGVVIFFGLLVSPEEIGLPGIEAEKSFEEDSHRPLINGAENEDEYDPNYSIQEDTTVPQVKAISFCQACRLPGVIPYSLAYACLKLVNYSFFFWLPFYLSNNFGWKEAEADQLSIWYDVGGIVGGTLQGFISDILQKRAPVLALSLLLAIGSLVGYSRSPNNKSINALLMTVTGFFIGGPSNMISSAISADLGRQELIQGSSEALATVTGIVDGTGSVGAAVGQAPLRVRAPQAEPLAVQVPGPGHRRAAPGVAGAGGQPANVQVPEVNGRPEPGRTPGCTLSGKQGALRTRLQELERPSTPAWPSARRQPPEKQLGVGGEWREGSRGQPLGHSKTWRPDSRKRTGW